MKVLYELVLMVMAVWITCQGVQGMGCNEGESQFDMKNKVEYCNDQRKWRTECTVDWGNIDGIEVCSRITEAVPTTTVTTTTTESVPVTQRETVTSSITVHVTSTIRTTESRTVTIDATTTKYSTTTTVTEKETVTQTPITDFITKTVLITPACTSTITAGLPHVIMTPSNSPAATPSPSHRTVKSPPSESELKSSNTNKIPDVVSYALAATTGVLFVLLLVVILGWVWTCFSTKRRYNKEKSAASARNCMSPVEDHFDNCVYSTNTQAPAPTEQEEKQDLGTAYYSVVEPDTSESSQREPEAIIYEQMEEMYDYSVVNGSIANGVTTNGGTVTATYYEVPISTISRSEKKTDKDKEKDKAENDYSQLQH